MNMHYLFIYLRAFVFFPVLIFVANPLFFICLFPKEVNNLTMCLALDSVANYSNHSLIHTSVKPKPQPSAFILQLNMETLKL